MLQLPDPPRVRDIVLVIIVMILAVAGLVAALRMAENAKPTVQIPKEPPHEVSLYLA